MMFIMMICRTIFNLIVIVFYAKWNQDNKNFSNADFSDSEKSLLSRGCKFTPYPKTNSSTVQHESASFSRKLRLIDYFSNVVTNEVVQEPLVQNPSKFDPPKGVNETLDCCINLINSSVNSLPKIHRNNSNLPPGERTALKELREKENLYIINADKGGSFVILNYDDYKRDKYVMNT